MPRTAPLLLVLVVLPLAACGGDDGPQGADRFPALIEEPALPVRPDTALAATDSVTVEGTLSALQGGVTRLNPAIAAATLGGWIRQVEAAEFEGRDAIAQNLRALRDALGQDPLDGPTIGALLAELGAQTTEAAPQAEPRPRAALNQLGTLLTEAGRGLAPADTTEATAE